MEATAKLYRRQALRAGRLRWFGSVQVVLPPSARVATLVAVTACAAVVVAAVVVEIPDSVTAHGVLLPPGGLLKIRAQRAGRVERVAVRNGNDVAAGSALLRISGLVHAPGERPALSARIASLERERGLVRERLEHDVAAVLERIDNHQRRAQLVRKRIDAARAELRARRDTAGRYQDRAARFAALAESGVVAKHGVDELAAAAAQAEAASLATAQAIAALEDELLVISGQLRQEAELEARLASDAEARLEALQRDLGASTLEAAVAVTAPHAGRVTAVAVRDGDAVQPGQVLLTLYDPAEPIEARLYLPAGRATAVATGQAVELQLDAYPHQYHGTRSAVVTSVAAAATPADEIVEGLSLGGAVFEIRASPAGQSLALPPGSTVKADIVRRRWPLYRWLLRSREDRHPAY